MVDIHCHIISGVDDGAKDNTMSIDMLKKAKESGTSKIVLTPHYYRGRYDVELEVIKEEFIKLKMLAKTNNIDIEMYLGQEIYYTDRIVEYYEQGIIGTINESRYMLIELSMIEFNLDEVISNLYEMRIKGIVPIIAHPERYKPFMKKPHLINRLIEEGCLFQLNAKAITGEFGKDVKKLANTFLKNDIYSFVGSDAHRSTGSRDTNMKEALAEIPSKTRRKFRYNGKAMLEDETIEFEGSKIKEKKGLFSFIG